MERRDPYLFPQHWYFSEINEVSHMKTGGRFYTCGVSNGWPILTFQTMQDGTHVVGAGADKGAWLIDLTRTTTGGHSTSTQVSVHDSPISSIRFFTPRGQQSEMIVTGSWDKTIKYWDLRQDKPVASLTCSDRIFALDVKHDVVVAATADGKVQIVDLNNPTSIFKTAPSALKHQLRTVAVFPGAEGFAVASTEGRTGVQYLKDETKKYSLFTSF